MISQTPPWTVLLGTYINVGSLHPHKHLHRTTWAVVNSLFNLSSSFLPICICM